MNHITRLLSWMVLLGALALIAAPARAASSFVSLYGFPAFLNSPYEANSSGGYPNSLTLGSDGSFYGTAYAGGSSGTGTIFEITPAGTLTVLHAFTGGNDGASPFGSLVQGSDGNFYGTTYRGGGSNNAGIIFKVTPSGTLTTLYSFMGGNDGALPFGSLVQGSDGNFYGTTEGGGGSANEGTVFKVTPSGALTILVSFNGTNGEFPASLVQGSDGNFYGVASGGSSRAGIVFRMTPSGTLTTLVNFNATTSGSSPFGLIQGSDGNFYGETGHGGNADEGTLFKMTPAGTLTTLYSFSGLDGNGDNSDGGNPFANLVQGNDGNFYGTTYEGGSVGDGTVYQITPSGTLTTIYSFPYKGGTGGDVNNDGANPKSTLVQGSDGYFYGTTESGGPGGTGTAFKVRPVPVITGISPTSGPVGTTVTITGTNLGGTTVVGFMSKHVTSFTVNSTGTQITTAVPPGATTGPIALLTNGVELKSSANFTVIPPPSITSFSPASGSVGTTVTITGTNLTGTTVVGFQGKHATSFTVNAAGTQITTTVPTGAKTGPLAVLTNGIEVKSTNSFTVTP